MVLSPVHAGRVGPSFGGLLEGLRIPAEIVQGFARVIASYDARAQGLSRAGPRANATLPGTVLALLRRPCTRRTPPRGSLVDGIDRVLAEGIVIGCRGGGAEPPGCSASRGGPRTRRSPPAQFEAVGDTSPGSQESYTAHAGPLTRPPPGAV